MRRVSASTTMTPRAGDPPAGAIAARTTGEPQKAMDPAAPRALSVRSTRRPAHGARSMRRGCQRSGVVTVSR